MIAEKDEKKRSMLWRTAITVSSVLIVCIAAFFGYRVFTGNPLEGRWSSQDTDLMMTIKGNGSVVLGWPEEEKDPEEVEMQYRIEKDTKTLTLYTDASKREAQADEETMETEGDFSDVGMLEGSYEYSLENGELTLTEREYGEQIVFLKD